MCMFASIFVDFMAIVLKAYILECVVGGQSLQVPLGFEIRLQSAKLVNDAITGVFQGVLWIVALGGLYSQLEPSEEGMLDLIGGKKHFSVVQKFCANQVAQRVILLLECYHYCIWGFGVRVDLQLGLAFTQKEQFESVWSIHDAVVCKGIWFGGCVVILFWAALLTCSSLDRPLVCAKAVSLEFSRAVPIYPRRVMILFGLQAFLHSDSIIAYGTAQIYVVSSLAVCNL